MLLDNPAANSDDARWKTGAGNFVDGKGVLGKFSIGYTDAGNAGVIEIRFSNVVIDKNSTVASASLKIYSCAANSLTLVTSEFMPIPHITVAATSGTAGTSLALGTAYVDWGTVGHGTSGQILSGCPDISSVVQEIINRQGGLLAML